MVLDLEQLFTLFDSLDSLKDILRTVDQNVDPCEDFFLHACGGWIKSNPIPPNEPLWNQVLALKKRNDQLLKRLLDDKTVRKRYIVVSDSFHNFIASFMLVSRLHRSH